jgi:hypothetical protein
MTPHFGVRHPRQHQQARAGLFRTNRKDRTAFAEGERGISGIGGGTFFSR